ncbi:hypothetical protein AB4865_10685 [Capnocytophaga sp. ARDL2]|uniref:hypothetical protein n=1 Tax=Capnocytophaga sp. ARDL2 TaxID=3238809 RepID=UPI003557E7F1
MYAIQNKRQHQADTRPQRERVTQKTLGVCPMGKPSQRPCPNSTRAENHRTEVPFANGFLKHRFLPKVGNFSDFKGIHIKKLQGDLQKSLERMANFYGFQPLDMSKYEFPYNVALALDQTQKHLQQNDDCWHRIQVWQDTNPTAFLSFFFSVEETFRTNNTLFYIPILPVYKLLKDKDKKHKKIGQLLLSVFTYVCHKAYVPYYTQDDCFLGYIYESFNDWIVNDWDEPQEKEVALLHLRQAQYVGERLYQKIRNSKNLQLFEKRINDFKACNETEKEILQISKAFFDLWQNFPSANLYTYLNREEISDEAELFTIDKYVSFSFDTQSDFFQYHIVEVVNGEVSQCSEIEEPTFVNRFDGVSSHFNFDFENLFFSLLHRLINLLNTF